ncbi:MAG TPA: hypothetical protein PLE60_03875 [Candidatus Latescibacteria bacterium]|nr:hypothetical protein [Candidatus Latescibacterota bacterium]
MLPNVPSYPGALHPLVVHFPIALLLVTPLFLLMAAISKNDRPQLRSCILVFMALGVLAAWVAVWTGQHAATLARITAPHAASAITQHEESAEATAAIFTVLFAVFAIRVAVDYLRKENAVRRPMRVFCIVFLVVYCVCSLVVVDAAHQGGRLVHEFGVRAQMGSARLGGTNP